MTNPSITGEGPGAIVAALRGLADALERDTTVRWGLETEEVGLASKTTITVWTMTPGEKPEPKPHVYVCGNGMAYGEAMREHGPAHVTWVPDTRRARGLTPGPVDVIMLAHGASHEARDAFRVLKHQQLAGDGPRAVGLAQTWCSAWRGDIPGRRCFTMLAADGSCPNAARHA